MDGIDSDFLVLVAAIYEDEPAEVPTVGPDFTRADLACVMALRVREMRSGLHCLIEAAIGGGGPVNVPAYVAEHHGGDWSKAVKFACEVIAHSQQRRTAEVRGTAGGKKRGV